MSASLLQRSLRLLEDNESKRRGSKKLRLHAKHKKQLGIKKTQAFKDNKIEKNLETLKLLGVEIPADISKKVFEVAQDKIELKQSENNTVFTDQDFEEFEKEYFVS